MNNIFETIPDNIETEVFEELMKSDNVRIERIISKGHKSPASGWYDQDNNEWILVVQGEAILLFADESSVKMKAGDYLNIMAHKKHKVEWTDPNIETIWLTIHY